MKLNLISIPNKEYHEINKQTPTTKLSNFFILNYENFLNKFFIYSDDLEIYKNKFTPILNIINYQKEKFIIISDYNFSVVKDYDIKILEGDLVYLIINLENINNFTHIVNNTKNLNIKVLHILINNNEQFSKNKIKKFIKILENKI